MHQFRNYLSTILLCFGGGLVGIKIEVLNSTILFVVNFSESHNFNFPQKHPKLFCLYLSNQISLRGRFVFKTNGRISSITSYKDHCCSFFTSWVIKQKTMLNFINLENTPNFGRTVRTQESSIFWGAHCMNNKYEVLIDAYMQRERERHKGSLRHAWDMPEICLIFAWNNLTFVSDMLDICLRYVWDMPDFLVI